MRKRENPLHSISRKKSAPRRNIYAEIRNNQPVNALHKQDYSSAVGNIFSFLPKGGVRAAGIDPKNAYRYPNDLITNRGIGNDTDSSRLNKSQTAT